MTNSSTEPASAGGDSARSTAGGADNALLRHTLATLAYRASKALRDASAEFGAFDPSGAGRAASHILAHMGDLMDWAVSIAEGRQAWKNAAPQAWEADVHRFFDGLARFDARLAETMPGDRLARQLFQGPIADALTHVGQLAMMRRLAGSPMKSENYFQADIAPGRVGLEQPAPRVEF